MTISRRNLLKVGGLGALGAAGLALPLGQLIQTKSPSRLPANLMPKPFQVNFVRPPVLAPTSSAPDADGVLTNYFAVTEMQANANLVPGVITPMWTYNGTFPGPTIKVMQGERAVLRVRNKLPATHPLFGEPFKTSVHLHGSSSQPQYDGYANDVTSPGWYKDYHYPNIQAARTLWYHDHAVHNTAPQVYSGLAAQYHMHDQTELSLLPQGRYDVPLIINDVMFAANGALGYDDRNHSGLYGDVILVNGKPWPVMKVKRAIYRFRGLNASLSRSFRPTLSTGDAVHMVATDAGLIPRSQAVANWRHGQAERYEFLIDFRQYTVGQRIELQNLSNPKNLDFTNTNKIMAFDVSDDSVVDDDLGGPDTDADWTIDSIPDLLSTAPVMNLTANDAVRTTSIRVEHSDVTNEWLINGHRWQDVVDSGFTLNVATPDLDDIEVWEIENKGGGWFHPVHIHLIDFKILTRNGKPPFAYEKGPKDVVYVGPGEKIRAVMRFEHQRGRYMIHCHNLVHEDHDMMQQFTVGLTPGVPDPNDPVTADPPKLDNLP
ncbi:MAG: bilirubin oxidase [Pseudonocardiales bacterium]|nr:MAG: bilirubin oxidase [Pseudonocardiales bacterium]